MRIKLPKQTRPSEILETIPEVLKFIRHTNRTGKVITQLKMANLLDAPPITYRSWESGLRTPSASAMGSLRRLVREYLPKIKGITLDMVDPVSINKSKTNGSIKTIVSRSKGKRDPAERTKGSKRGGRKHRSAA